MAKQQSFGDKVKKLAKESSGRTIKFVAAVKTSKGTYRFNQKFVQIRDEKMEDALLDAEYKRMIETTH